MNFKLSSIVYINEILTLSGMISLEDTFDDLIRWKILSLDNEELVLRVSNMIYRFPLNSDVIYIEYYKAHQSNHKCLESTYVVENGKLFVDLLGDEFSNFPPSLQEYTAFITNISRVFHITDISLSSRLSELINGPK